MTTRVCCLGYPALELRCLSSPFPDLFKYWKKSDLENKERLSCVNEFLLTGRIQFFVEKRQRCDTLSKRTVGKQHKSRYIYIFKKKTENRQTNNAYADSIEMQTRGIIYL